MASFSSRNGGEVRLEREAVSMRCRRRSFRRFTAREDRKNGQEGAPDNGEEDRRRGRGSGSPELPESSGDGGGFAELRRAIPSIWGNLSRGEKRGQREERGGFIGEVLMAFNSRGKSAE
jgi:hypothetical protein